jgi:proteasome assembly chaperone (PAC2) family protein
MKSRSKKRSAWLRIIGDVPYLKKPVAIIGSPGLRSVGVLAVDYLIEVLGAELFAELYSPTLPAVYFGTSYFGTDGSAGVKVLDGIAELPKIEFYYWKSRKLHMILTKGYQPAFSGQFDVAYKIVWLYEQFKVRKVIGLAAHGGGKDKIFCAATTKAGILDLKKYNVMPRQIGGFYGLTALVAGLSGIKNIECICLFGRTSANVEFLEMPDLPAVKVVLESVKKILNLDFQLPARMFTPIVEKPVEYKKEAHKLRVVKQKFEFPYYI